MTTATIASIAAAALSGINLFVLADIARRVYRLENLVMSKRGKLWD